MDKAKAEASGWPVLMVRNCKDDAPIQLLELVWRLPTGCLGPKELRQIETAREETRSRPRTASGWRETGKAKLKLFQSNRKRGADCLCRLSLERPFRLAYVRFR